MRACRWALLALILQITLPLATAAVTVGGLSSARSYRPFSGPDYENIRARLSDSARFGPGGVVSTPVEFASDVDTAGESALDGLDVLVLSEAHDSLVSPDATDIAQFVLDGGYLVLISDTLHVSRPAAGNGALAIHDVLQRLDNGDAARIGDVFGVQSAHAASVQGAISAVLDGPFGALGVGDTLGATYHNPLAAGSLGQVLATRHGSPILVEIAPRALGPNAGGVLVAGDILFSDYFVPPGDVSLLENENNAIVFENFVAQAAQVPEPGTIVLAAMAGFAVLWAGRAARVGESRRGEPN